MVKIGRAPKLTKVQARRAEKEKESQKRNENPNSLFDNAKACGDFRILEKYQEDPPRLDCPSSTVNNVKTSNILQCGQGDPNRHVSGDLQRPAIKSDIKSTKLNFALSYPENLEKAIAEAEYIISRFNQVYNKGKKQNFLNGAKHKYSEHLKISLQMLKDCRYIKLLKILEKRRRSNDGNVLFYTIHAEMGAKQQWAANMAKNIGIAVTRLRSDFSWLASVEGKCILKEPMQTPPLLLNISKRKKRFKSFEKQKIRSAQKLCLQSTYDCLLDFTGINNKDELTTGDEEESPRERLKRKIDEHEECNKDTKNSKMDELTSVILGAALAVQKKGRREAYDDMTRKERRSVMRRDLMLKLSARQLLPIFLRNLHSLLSSKDGQCPVYHSRELVDVVIAVMAQSEKQHVIQFIKVISAEFLGPERDVFFSRQEYYIYWSVVLRTAKIKLMHRWKSFVGMFVSGQHEMEEIVAFAHRSSRLATELLLRRFYSLARSPDNAEKKNDIENALKKYSERIEGYLLRYGRVVAHNICAEQIQKAYISDYKGVSTEMGILYGCIGVQNLQTQLLQTVETSAMRVRRNLSQCEDHCVSAVRNLLSKIVCRDSLRLLTLVVSEFSNREFNDEQRQKCYVK